MCNTLKSSKLMWWIIAKMSKRLFCFQYRMHIFSVFPQQFAFSVAVRVFSTDSNENIIQYLKLGIGAGPMIPCLVLLYLLAWGTNKLTSNNLEKKETARVDENLHDWK